MSVTLSMKICCVPSMALKNVNVIDLANSAKGEAMLWGALFLTRESDNSLTPKISNIISIIHFFK